MAGENYEPDWNSWLLVTEVTVEAAVALSLNVDPRRLLAWKMLKMRTQPTEISKFDDRVYWVKQWGLRGPNWVAENYEGHTPTIYLWEFAQRAKAARWDRLPAQLMTLATAKSDSHSRSRKRGSGAADQPQRRSSRPKRRALTPRKRGPKPEQFERVKAAMIADIRGGQRHPRNMREKEWESTYDASRDTCRKALAAAVSEIAVGNSDK